MRLRHKKPINSYAGQTNNDSNDAQDEDFFRSSVLQKKGQLFKQRSSCEKIRKYAQFLCNFVNSANQNYRDHGKANIISCKQSFEKKDDNQVYQLLSNSQMTRNKNSDKIQEVVSKQQLKIQKTLQLLNKDAELTKKIKKDRLKHSEPDKNREIKKTNLGIRATDNSNKKTITLNTISIDQAPDKKNYQNKNQVLTKQSPVQQSQPIIEQPRRPPPQTMQHQIPSNAFNEQLQNLILIQKQLLMNPLYGAINPALYSMIPPYALPQMINYQAYFDQIKNNPYYAMMSPIGNPLSMLQQNLLNNCIPLSRLPFNKDSQINNKQQNPAKNINQEHRKQELKNSTSILKQQQKDSMQIQRPIQFKSKSCYHIGIAYTIYFTNLKEKGYTNFTSSADLQKIDPTYNAKRMKQRKVSDKLLANMNQTSAIQN